MTQELKTFVGVKMIEARPMTFEAFHNLQNRPTSDNFFKDTEGYMVKYPDGYESWSPKDVFESAYFEMPKEFPQEYDQNLIDSMVRMAMVTQSGADELLAHLVTRTGFSLQCVGNFDPEEIVTMSRRINTILEISKKQLWGFLKFVHQWAKTGLGEQVHGPLDSLDLSLLECAPISNIPS